MNYLNTLTIIIFEDCVRVWRQESFEEIRFAVKPLIQFPLSMGVSTFS